MRAYRIESFGSVDGIVLGESPDPQPGTREILVRVRATSLNYRDLMVLKAIGRGPTKQSIVPLSDGPRRGGGGRRADEPVRSR
jgi:NADPH:quinone reductase-like Zn-dependent oxidoreductase